IAYRQVAATDRIGQYFRRLAEVVDGAVDHPRYAAGHDQVRSRLADDRLQSQVARNGGSTGCDDDLVADHERCGDWDRVGLRVWLREDGIAFWRAVAITIDHQHGIGVRVSSGNARMVNG